MTQDFVPKQALLDAMAPLYSRHGKQGLYKRYVTTRRVSGKNVDDYDPFYVTVLPGKPRKFSTDAVTGEVRVQELTKSFHFRYQDLPDGVGVEQLTKNDKFEYAGQTFTVVEIRHMEPFIRIAVEGG